ncbi:MAG TPA: TRAP transporter small permease [Thermodesulfobacteriota bacterium]|nr:TRAP transporter small permease [Thermodesulfobacteriota bacterium]
MGATRFKKLSDGTDRVVTWAVVVMLLGLTAVVTLQIIARVFFEAFSWTEELSRYLLVWTTFLGAGMGFKRGSHVAFTFVIDLLGAPLKRSMAILVYLLSLLFFAVGIVYGIQMIQNQVYQISPAMGVSMRVVYLAIPLGFAVMAVHVFPLLLEEIAGRARAKE